MEINRNNYEAYLLDQMEGKLSLSDQQKLASFLRSNPDCAPLFDESESWVLEGKNVSFSGKDELKKRFPGSDTLITESNFDLFSIARLEGDLTASQELEHQQMLEGDLKRGQEWTLWQQTRLEALSLEYGGKKTLKKKAGVKKGVIWLSVLSSAAAITLLFILLRVDTPTGGIPLSEHTPELSSSEPEPQTSLETQVSSPQENSSSPEKPALFSIKKDREKPVVSSGEAKPLPAQTIKDTLLPVEEKKLEPRSLTLASLNLVEATSIHPVEYDRIEALDIPPIKASITNLSLAQLAEINLPETVDAFTEEKDLSFWSVANAGIQGINKITGANMSLMASRDKGGEVSGFRFKSKRFSVSRPIERSE